MSEHISNIPIPDDLASNNEKMDVAYGKEAGQFIESQWYQGQLTHRRRWINEMRSFSRGEQDTKPYKDLIEGIRKKDKEEGKLRPKTHKIDYVPLKVLPTFKDIIVNAIDESLFVPRAEAIDPVSINRKKDYFKKIEQDFYTKDIAGIISEGVGINIAPVDVAKNEEDLSIKKIEYKPKIEIAQELAVQNVLKHEKFETIKDKVDEDLFDLGIGVLQHYTDYTEGIKFKYIDPYYYIHSGFQMDDGRDIRYHGVLNKGTLAELIKESGGMSDEDKLVLKNEAIGKSENEEPYNPTEDGERIIEYISFAWLTGEERVFKKLRKDKSVKLIDRTKDGYSPSKPSRNISIPYQVWYEGIYVPQAEICVKWRKIPNQVEKEVNIPISPFIVYAPKVKRHSESGDIRFDSLVQRAIPIVNDLHRDWYKFQQLKMELRPNTVTINPQSLNNVLLNGDKIDPQDILDLYFGRGVLIANEFDSEGDPMGKAITEQGGGINNSALGFLSNEFTNNYNRLRQLLGINELRDGTTKPNSKTAVTVQKLLLASSNNQTNHIVKASFSISLRSSEACSLRLYDVLTTPALKNRYLDIIGSDNVELLDELKNFPMSKFAIYFDFKPDNAERIDFEQSIVNSYNQKEINVAQYNKTRLIRNVKEAIQFLEAIIEKNEAEREAIKIQNIKRQAEANAQTSILTEQTKQQTITIAWTAEKQKLLFIDQLEAQKEQRVARTGELQAITDHERKMELEGLKVLGQDQKQESIQKGKVDLEDQRASNQAQLIDKRKNGTPVDFDNSLDRIFEENGIPEPETK